MHRRWLTLAFLIALPASAAVKKAPPPKPQPTAKKPVKKDMKMIATFTTSLGTFKVKLFPDKAPKTVANFVELAMGWKSYTNPKTHEKVAGTKEKPGKPYYDGVIFHRIIPGFMIQGGDPTGTGTEGPGYMIADEIDKSLKHDKPGKLSMAKTNKPNSAGSQFFITVGAAPWLDGTYAQFGEVIEEPDGGMKVVNKIAAVPTGAQDRPNDPPVIKSIRVE